MVCQDKDSFEAGYKQAQEIYNIFYGNEIKKLQDRIVLYEHRIKMYQEQLEQQEKNEKYIKLGKAMMTIVEGLK